MIELAIAKRNDALELMWAFASGLVEKHGMDGDDTLTDDEHKRWQEAAGQASALLAEALPVKTITVKDRADAALYAKDLLNAGHWFEVKRPGKEGDPWQFLIKDEPGHPMPITEEDKATYAVYREEAKLEASDELEIDDDAVVSIGEGGAFVAAWVWVAGSPCSGEKCQVLVEDGDDYHATPCGSFCNGCMETHAKGCGICAKEFELEGPEQ